MSDAYQKKPTRLVFKSRTFHVQYNVIENSENEVRHKPEQWLLASEKTKIIKETRTSRATARVDEIRFFVFTVDT